MLKFTDYGSEANRLVVQTSDLPGVPWTDFASIKNEADFDYAIDLVRHDHPSIYGTFRIIDTHRHFVTVYELLKCDQCAMASINGVPCHETGCPNSKARWDSDERVWIPTRVCVECGCTVDADDLCCNDPDNEMDYEDMLEMCGGGE